MMICTSVKSYLISTPIGQMEISSCEDGLHGLKFVQLYDKEPLQEDASEHIELLKNEDSAPSPVLYTLEWLQMYFIKNNKISTVGLPPICAAAKPKKGSFEDVIWATMAKEVPFGSTVSYQRLATLANYPRAARAVGNVMRNNQMPIILPCHRVIKSDGTMGNYSCGKFLKQWLLQHEQFNKDS